MLLVSKYSGIRSIPGTGGCWSRKRGTHASPTPCTQAGIGHMLQNRQSGGQTYESSIACWASATQRCIADGVFAIGVFSADEGRLRGGLQLSCLLSLLFQ